MLEAFITLPVCICYRFICFLQFASNNIAGTPALFNYPSIPTMAVNYQQRQEQYHSLPIEAKIKHHQTPLVHQRTCLHFDTSCGIAVCYQQRRKSDLQKQLAN
jgi:hypothetical protein